MFYTSFDCLSLLMILIIWWIPENSFFPEFISDGPFLWSVNWFGLMWFFQRFLWPYNIASIIMTPCVGGPYSIHHCWWSWPFNHRRSIEVTWLLWIRHNWTGCSIFWSFSRWSSHPGLVIISLFVFKSVFWILLLTSVSF